MTQVSNSTRIIIYMNIEEYSSYTIYFMNTVYSKRLVQYDICQEYRIVSLAAIQMTLHTYTIYGMNIVYTIYHILD